MKKIFVGILAVLVSCGAISSAGAQGPAVHGTPLATPMTNPAVTSHPAAATERTTPMPTPSKNRSAATGHIRMNTFSPNNANQNATRLNVVAPVPASVPSFSMGAYPIHRDSANFEKAPAPSPTPVPTSSR